MKFVFFNSYYDANNGLELCTKLGGKYHVCPKHWIAHQKEIYKDIDECDMVIIWNSLEPCTYWIKDICIQLNKKYLFLEYGFIPQKGNYHLDSEGIIKQSSLNRSLDWLTNEMANESEEYIAEFLDQKKWRDRGSEYILCPLQLPWDCSIYLCSKYKTMDEFIKDVINLYPEEKIIVTPHPMLRKNDVLKNTEVLSKVTLDIKNCTMHMAQKAKAVVGINSTVLYESLALGKKTIALGDCPIKTHNGDRKLALCAVQKQFKHLDTNQFLYLVDYFTNIKVTLE